MNEQTTKGVTHVWPFNMLTNPNAKPISDERESDVWQELRDLTFDGDVRGCVAVALPSAYQEDRDEFLNQLTQEDVALNRVSFFSSREVELEIHSPATEARTFPTLRTASGEPVTSPAQPAKVEKRTEHIPFHLGSKSDAEQLIKEHRSGALAAVVLWQPCDLEYLPKVKAACPDLPVYIFHLDGSLEKWGVEREAGSGSWQTRFHTKTEALTIPENVDVVVRGLCNVGTVSMWAALPKHGKSFLFLSIMKALLSGNAWLGHFEVSQAKRVVYLVPEVGLRGVMKRLRQLNMVDYLYDPVSNPEGRLFVQTLSSSTKLQLDDEALLQAVQGADVFIDPIIRYIEGDENSASDQRLLSNKLLALITAEARSVWCAHHSPKAFKDVTDITTQNVLRGTGEFAAFPDIIFGVLKIDEETSRLHIKCTDARDDDEYLGAFEVEMRPWINDTGDMKLVVTPGSGTPLREQKRDGSDESSRREQALALLDEGKLTRDEICKRVRCGTHKLATWNKERQKQMSFDANQKEVTA